MILNAAQGETRMEPPGGVARENLPAGRRGHAASLKWLAVGLRESEKRGKYFSAPKLQNSGGATCPADHADCFVCKGDCDAIISPLDKDGSFGEVERGCKAVNKDAVKMAQSKEGVKNGFSRPHLHACHDRHLRRHSDAPLITTTSN
jgi:hypothetical protein